MNKKNGTEWEVLREKITHHTRAVPNYVRMTGHPLDSCSFLITANPTPHHSISSLESTYIKSWHIFFHFKMIGHSLNSFPPSPAHPTGPLPPPIYIFQTSHSATLQNSHCPHRLTEHRPPFFPLWTCSGGRWHQLPQGGSQDSSACPPLTGSDVSFQLPLPSLSPVL